MPLELKLPKTSKELFSTSDNEALSRTIMATAYYSSVSLRKTANNLYSLCGKEIALPFSLILFPK